MNNSGLLASSGTQEGIINLISEFYYTHINNIELIPTGKNQWNISKSDKTLTGVRVVLKGKRYRFELV
jgi:hypothetical protein